MTTKFAIYKITNLINNKIYIGKKEFTNEKIFNTYYGSGILIKQAIKKYGLENFQKDILCYATSRTELNQKEIEYIALYDTIRPNGYNISKGGDGGDVNYGKSIVEKLIINKKRSKKLKNQIVSQETRLKLSKAHLGKKLSDETKQKISDKNKNELNPNFGRKQTPEEILKRVNTRRAKDNYKVKEETKQKISNTLKGKSFLSEEGRKGISKAHKNKITSEETKKKIRDSLIGKKHSEERKRNVMLGRLRNKEMKSAILNI